MEKNILITGTSSGLGKFLSEEFKSYKLNRKNINKKIFNKKWKLIIHCAYDSKSYNIDNFKKYFDDNIVLSNIVSKLRGKKIFISTVQVYENNKKNKRKEIDQISYNKLSAYPLSKIICESFFNQKGNLILRVGSMVGSSMRRNTIKKITKEKKTNINLNKKSKFSFVSYEEIYEIIKILLKKKKDGIYNVVRNDLLDLNYISSKFNKDINYGKHYFECTKADNSKVNKFYNLNKESSFDILKKFVKKKKI